MLDLMAEQLKVMKDLRDPQITQDRVVREHLGHFRRVVNSQLRLPINLPEEVYVLNSALLDVELSLSLVSLH